MTLLMYKIIIITDLLLRKIDEPSYNICIVDYCLVVIRAHLVKFIDHSNGLNEVSFIYHEHDTFTNETCINQVYIL